MATVDDVRKAFEKKKAEQPELVFTPRPTIEPNLAALNSISRLFSESRIERLQREVLEMQREELKERRALKANPPEKKARSGGAKKIQLDYEKTCRLYWQMRGELEDRGEWRNPSNPEIAQRITETVTRIGTETFRDRYQEWRADGKPWPCPRPDDE